MRLRLLALLAAAALGLTTCTGAEPAAGPIGPHDGVAELDADHLVELAEPRPPPTASVVDPEPREPAVPQGRAHAHLRMQLHRLLDDPELAVDGTVSVSVLNDRGYPLLARDADTPVLPASTVKLVVAAAALFELGPDHRYVTRLAATAEPDEAGLLAGDLVLVGGGDPALATPRFGEDADPDRPRTPLEALADAVADAGVHTVAGDVVGDPSLFADEPTARGWPDRYLERRHARPVSALTVDAGLEITYHDDDRVVGVAADDPAVTAATRIVALLDERDVEVGGAARASREPPAAPVDVGSVESPPLEELLRHALRWSDNHLTDGIFRTLGQDLGGTWKMAADATLVALDHVGLEWSPAVLADGSGLSRDNRLTASLITRLDLAMHRSDLGELWRDLMAVAGESGTLRHRLRHTLAEERLHGKTGSLRDVRALAGSVIGADGRRYHLAVIGNDLAGEERARVHLLADEITLSLTEDLLGCERTYDEEAYAEGERPAYTVRCPS